MDVQNLDNLRQILQASISPIALVSGVGLLILSQTNRLGRVMDRLRGLADQRRTMKTPDTHLDQEMSVLHHRARILRATIAFAVLSALFASVLVLLLFTTAMLGAALEWLAAAVFAGSLLSLIVSLVLFMVDMNLSLRAVQEEMLR